MTTQRFLAIDSGGVTFVFATTVFFGFNAVHKARFETTTVRVGASRLKPAVRSPVPSQRTAPVNSTPFTGAVEVRWNSTN